MFSCGMMGVASRYGAIGYDVDERMVGLNVGCSKIKSEKNHRYALEAWITTIAAAKTSDIGNADEPHI